MKVALNMLHLAPGETGGSELYARRLVPALLEARNSLQVTVLAADEAVPSLAQEPWAGDVELIGLSFNPRSRARRVLAEQTLLPRKVRSRQVDLLHNLFTTAPAAPGVPQVTTILDVIYKRFPETHSGLRARGLAVLTSMAARRSRRIVTISEAAKADIVHFLGVSPEKVDVTYPGPALPQTHPADARAALGLGTGPIVLTVSAKRPHKNLERLFEAFAQVRAEPPPVLVVPGYETFHEQQLRRHAVEVDHADRIRFAGWVADEVLEGLFREAACLVFPSLAEGFGLPVLDALVRGTPVACSKTSSLPEVAGDAAVYFDPTDIGGITAAIERLLSDQGLQERLRAAGPRQAAKFTWASTAEGTLHSYDQALASNDQAVTASTRS